MYFLGASFMLFMLNEVSYDFYFIGRHHYGEAVTQFFLRPFQIRHMMQCAQLIWFKYWNWFRIDISYAKVHKTLFHCIYKCCPLDGTIVGPFIVSLGFCLSFFELHLVSEYVQITCMNSSVHIWWHLNIPKCCSEAKVGPRMSFSIS